MAAESAAPPDLAAIEAARATLGDLVEETPVHRWCGAAVADALGPESAVFLKLELFQRTGTFKARGALLNALALDEAGRARGVTAVSAGNHAIAVAFAAHRVGTSAKVVMMEGADPFRVAQVRRYGAELVLVPDVHAAFEAVRAIEADEGRTFIHPFEGRTIALGTATVGLELARQVPALDAVIVPIGGGGLCAGVSCAIKTLQPNCRVYGVEPEGADTMHRSFAAGSPQAIDKVTTIADSLGAPYAQPYSFGLCRRYVDELVKIGDEAMRRTMGLLFAEMKLAVEPAGAAATAALLGPLAGRRSSSAAPTSTRRRSWPRRSSSDARGVSEESVRFGAAAEPVARIRVSPPVPLYTLCLDLMAQGGAVDRSVEEQMDTLRYRQFIDGGGEVHLIAHGQAVAEQREVHVRRRAEGPRGARAEQHGPLHPGVGCDDVDDGLAMPLLQAVGHAVLSALFTGLILARDRHAPTSCCGARGA